MAPPAAPRRPPPDETYKKDKKGLISRLFFVIQSPEGFLTNRRMIG